MNREEALEVWWKGVHENSKLGLYVMVADCLRPMQVGKTFEFKWRDRRDSGERSVLEGRLVAEEPDGQGTGVDTSGLGSVPAPDCGEGGRPNCVRVVCPNGQVRSIFPQVSNEEVEGWWRRLKLESKDLIHMLMTWLEELKGNDVIRIKKPSAKELQFSRTWRVGPARADRSSAWSTPRGRGGESEKY